MNDFIRNVKTDHLLPSVGPYAQVTIVEASAELVFVSGQLPLDSTNGKLMEGDMADLTAQVMENIRSLLIAAGSSMDSIIRVEIFCTDLKNDFSTINEVYGTYFTGSRKPSRQTIQAAALPLGSPIEISCIAVVAKGNR